ncbi:unnamed protein product, partial [Brachionus calyciflorus]
YGQNQTYYGNNSFLYDSLFPGCKSLECQNSKYICNTSRSLMTEIQGMYPIFNGWYHLDKNWRLTKKNLSDFVETNILGIKYYTSSCPSIDPLCLSRTSFWTISDYPTQYSNYIVNMTVCNTVSYGLNESTCYSYCSNHIPVVYCDQYDSFSYYFTPINVMSALTNVQSLTCFGINASSLPINTFNNQTYFGNFSNNLQYFNWNETNNQLLAANETVFNACQNSKSLLQELSNPYRLPGSLNGWFHLDKNIKILKDSMFRFTIDKNLSSYPMGPIGMSSSCPSKNQTCEGGILYWTTSDYPSENMFYNQVSSLKICSLFSVLNQCFTYCITDVPVAYCSQSNSYTYYLSSINTFGFTNALNLLPCFGIDQNLLNFTIPNFNETFQTPGYYFPMNYSMPYYPFFNQSFPSNFTMPSFYMNNSSSFNPYFTSSYQSTEQNFNHSNSYNASFSPTTIGYFYPFNSSLPYDQNITNQFTHSTQNNSITSANTISDPTVSSNFTMPPFYMNNSSSLNPYFTSSYQSTEQNFNHSNSFNASFSPTTSGYFYPFNSSLPYNQNFTNQYYSTDFTQNSSLSYQTTTEKFSNQPDSSQSYQYQTSTIQPSGSSSSQYVSTHVQSSSQSVTSQAKTTTTTTTLTPCLKGYYSKSGFEPCYFDFTVLGQNATFQPVTNSIDPNAHIDEITFKCFVKCPKNVDCSRLNGTVIWYVGLSEIIRTEMRYNQTTQDLYGYLNETSWSNYMNQDHSCEIIPEYRQVQSNLPFKSQSQFIGIECEMPNQSAIDKSASTKSRYQVTLKEGNLQPAKLRCKLNLPVACKDHKVTDCDLKIWINYKNMSNYNRVVTKECIPQSNGARSCDACNKFFKKESNSLSDDDRVKEWQINTNMETKNKNYKNEEYEVEIKTNNNSANLRDVYKKLNLPTLNIKFAYQNRPLTKFASCYNDPHCRTFDGKAFELQQAGEYQMYENTETQTRIHLINKLCSPGSRPYCLNNVFIQSMHEIVKLDLEYNLFYYTNLKTKSFDQPIIFRVGNALNSFDQLIITSSNYLIQVETGYGLTIKISGSYYWWIEKFVYTRMDINPSKSDFGITNGLFGNFNDNKNDDFIYLRNSINKGKETDILNSFKADASTGIPSFLNNQYYSVDQVEIQDKYSYCQCLNTDPTQTVNSECLPSLNEKAFNKPKNKNKRSAEPNLDFEALATSPAVLYVKKYGIHNIDKFKRKRQAETVPANVTNCKIDANFLPSAEYEQNCIDDILNVPDTPWDLIYQEDKKSASIDILSNDINLFVTDVNGNKVPDATLIKNNCPNDCSSHGSCSLDGICICEPGYSQVDCSVKLSDPPKILGVSTDSSIIDSSNGNPKEVIISLARFVAENPSSKFKISTYTKSSTKSFNEAISSELTGFPLNYQTTLVQIDSVTKNTASDWYLLKLYATNDGISYSDPITLMVYPSVSYKCNNDAENFSCEKIVTDAVVTSPPKVTSSSNRITQNISFLVIFTMLSFKIF